jgi:hypothetical protein
MLNEMTLKEIKAEAFEQSLRRLYKFKVFEVDQQYDES